MLTCISSVLELFFILGKATSKVQVPHNCIILECAVYEMYYVFTFTFNSLFEAGRIQDHHRRTHQILQRQTEALIVYLSVGVKAATGPHSH